VRRFLTFGVPVAVGPGGILPALLLGGMFAGVAFKVGAPVAAAAVLGATAGTASLLAHELGHVRAARRVGGVRPVSVSLFWLGAGVRFEGKYGSGREQARVAIGGPLASLGVAAALVPILFAPLPVTAKKLLLMLVLLNVVLAAVNVIPARPLDGYKILVGLLWSALGSEGLARRLIRGATRAWLALELAATGVLLVERPQLGFVMAIVGASLLGQRVVERSRLARG
jgi:Zn-dependent protease